MWARCPHTLVPLTKKTPVNVKCRCNKIEKYAFKDIRRILARGVLLAYQDFNEAFKIHTDDRDFR